MPTVHLIIKGKVQGVFYRASAREEAERLGLTGWIRNTYEGNVEALVTGTEERLQQFISWSWRGPAEAVVTEVAVNATHEQEFDRFQVLKGKH